MGRSSKEQTDANHRRIVAAAGNLFRAHGYEAVGIADVMKAAGLTQGGFYRHFASKEALAAEAWAQGFELGCSIWRRQDKGGSPIAGIVDYYLAPKPPEHRCPMVAHGGDVGRMAEDCALRDIYADGARAMYEIFMDAAKDSTPKDRSNLLFAAMIGVNMLSRATGDTDWLADLRKSVEDAAAKIGGSV